MAIRSWPMDAVGGAPLYSGRMLRQAQMSPLVGGATAARPFGARSGVRPGTSATTVTATATTWTVQPHAGVLDVQAASEAGPYGYAVDSAVSGTVNAANAANPRVDLVYVQLSDPAEADGSSTPGVTIGYQVGLPAASPVAPTGPARSMPLGQINVPKSGGGTPTVTWVAPYLSGPGAPYLVRSDAERDDLLTLLGATPEAPLVARHIGAANPKRGTVEVHAGSGWGTVDAARTRVLSPAIFGTIGTNNLVPDQTIPAGCVPTADLELLVSASIQCLIAPNGGARLEVLVDGAVAKSATFGNGASGNQNMALTIDLVTTLPAAAAHTVRARIVNVAGTNTVSNDTGQTFSMSVRPTVAL